MPDSIIYWPFVAITSLIAAVVMIVVWRANTSIPGVREWAFGFVLAVAGMVGFMVRDLGAPLVISVFFGNLLVNGAYYAGILGGAKFLRIRADNIHKFFVISISVCMAVMVFFTVADDMLMVRVAVAAAFLSVCDAFGAWMFWSRSKEQRSLANGIIVVGFGGHGLVSLARAIWAGAEAIGMPLAGTSAVMDMANLSTVATPVLLAMGYLAVSNERLLNQAQTQAERDPLTGINNRRAFMTVADHVCKQRIRDRTALSLLMLDLDHFKAINDTHGHGVGDDVLCHVVQGVSAVLRNNDVFARYGGEEFVVLLPNTGGRAALAVAERIRQAVQVSPFRTRDGRIIGVTGSIGLVSIPAEVEGPPVDRLIDWADQALYAAKAGGRNRVHTAEGEPAGALAGQARTRGRGRPHSPLVVPTPPPAPPTALPCGRLRS